MACASDDGERAGVDLAALDLDVPVAVHELVRVREVQRRGERAETPRRNLPVPGCRFSESSKYEYRVPPKYQKNFVGIISESSKIC